MIVPGSGVFPPGAFEKSENGTSVVTLKISPSGHMQSCEIKTSSGHEDLDIAACSLLSKRLILSSLVGTKEYSLDQAVRWSATGKPNKSPNEAIPINPSRWFLPDDYPQTSLTAGIEGAVMTEFEVDVDGRPTNCHVVEMTADAALGQRTCDLIMQRGSYLPAINDDGSAVSSTVRHNVIWKLPTKTAGQGKILFYVNSATNAICYYDDGGVKRQLTESFCKRLAQAVQQSGGSLKAPVFMALPNPPFATSSGIRSPDR